MANGKTINKFIFLQSLLLAKLNTVFNRPKQSNVFTLKQLF